MLFASPVTCCSASLVAACWLSRAVLIGAAPPGWPEAIHPAVRSRSSSMLCASRMMLLLSTASCSVRLKATALLAPELIRRPPRITAASVGMTMSASSRHRTRQLLRASRDRPRRAGARAASSGPPGPPGPGEPGEPGEPGIAVSAAVPPLPSPTVSAPATWAPLDIPGPSAPLRWPATGRLRTAFAPHTNRGSEDSLRASTTEVAEHRTPLSLTSFTAGLATSGRPRQLWRRVAKRVRTYNHLPLATHGVFPSNFVQRCGRWDQGPRPQPDGNPNRPHRVPADLQSRPVRPRSARTGTTVVTAGAYGTYIVSHTTAKRLQSVRITLRIRSRAGSHMMRLPAGGRCRANVCRDVKVTLRVINTTDRK